MVDDSVWTAACQGCDQYTTWGGKTGIKLDTPLAKLLFAARFGDLNMLISSQVTGSSLYRHKLNVLCSCSHFHLAALVNVAATGFNHS